MKSSVMALIGLLYLAGNVQAFLCICGGSQYCPIDSTGCKDKKNGGESCEYDNECLAGKCDGVCRCNAQYACKNGNHYCGVDLKCHEKLNAEEKCSSKGQCKSDICNIVCGCKADNECTSGKCDKSLGFGKCYFGCKKLGDSNECKSGETCIQYNCAKKKLIGEKCEGDYWCNSGNCNQNGICVQCKTKDHCGSDKVCIDWTCVAPAGFQGYCKADFWCKSGKCLLDKKACAQCKTKSDCGSGKVCVDWICVAPAGLKGYCKADFWCQSPFICSHNKCLKKIGEVCINQYDCASGNCSGTPKKCRS
jgi:hypothetical protein